MSLGKSIDSRISKIVYVLVIINLTSIILLFILPTDMGKLILLMDLIVHILASALFLNPKKEIFLIRLFLLIIFLYFLLMISFRHIRSFFPNIGRDKSIVGFAEYFNYPIYFDIFLFSVIIIIPFISYFIVMKLKR